MTIKDRVVVITGSSMGLGECLTSEFTKLGAIVVINSNLEKGLKKLSKQYNVIAIIADVTKEKDIRTLLKKVVKKYGRLDIWVNNAGKWMARTPVENIKINKVRNIFEVNVFGTIIGSKIALKHMIRQGHGIIVNIISTSALEGRPSSSGYCASKHAVNGFTKSLRLETKNNNIKIISVYPHGMNTQLFNEKKPENFNKMMTPQHVAKKIVSNLLKNKPNEEIVIRN